MSLVAVHPRDQLRGHNVNRPVLEESGRLQLLERSVNCPAVGRLQWPQAVAGSYQVIVMQSSEKRIQSSSERRRLRKFNDSGVHGIGRVRKIRTSLPKGMLVQQ